MSARAYILIKTAEGKAHEIARILRRKLGVTFVDCVEGPPDVVAMIEADDNQKLADLAMKALTSVENLMEDSQVLPVCNDKLNMQRHRAEPGIRR